MNVLICGTGSAGLSAGAEQSRVRTVHAVFHKKTVEYLACLPDIRLPSARLCHPPVLQDHSRGRRIGTCFLNGAATGKKEEHWVPRPVDTCIGSLICFRDSPASPGER